MLTLFLNNKKTISSTLEILFKKIIEREGIRRVTNRKEIMYQKEFLK